MSNVAHLVHLARRFTGSLSREPLSTAEIAIAEHCLLPAELEMWWRMPLADRRHSLRVAEAMIARLPAPPPRAAVAAALLHDVGKLDAGLGTTGRVAATLWGMARRGRRTQGTSRFARYHRHEPTGAQWLAAEGSDPMTVALVGRTADAPGELLAALVDADDAS